jgi:hypothetical protein
MAKQNALMNQTEGTFLDQSDGSSSSGLVQVTTNIREDQAFALELMETAERQRRGGSFDRAEFFQEALDLLIKANIVAIRLRGNSALKKRDA